VDQYAWQRVTEAGPDGRATAGAVDQDEISTVEFYANIANAAADPLSRVLISSIVGDEYGFGPTSRGS
jgi:hypothetical protein